MRCSASERLLDRYVEGSLSPRTMLDVSAHVKSCVHCSPLLTELRVVDALLETTKPPELPINFTFAVMAEVRTAAVPRVRRFAWWTIALGYVALAWLAGFGIALNADDAARAAMMHALAPPIADANALLNAMDASSHALGGGSPLVTGLGVTVLIADVLALSALLYFYRTLRPRLAARLARATESVQ